MFKSILSKISFVFLLAIFLSGPLALIGCSGGEPGFDEQIIEGCTSDADCDALITICDSDDNDATNVTPTSACDGDGDGYVDVACASFDDDGDGELSEDELAADRRFSCDNCIGTANSDQVDIDKDHIGDACDSVNCTDADGDTVCDSSDNCPNVYNADQTADIDGDRTGDACDDDKDGDSFANTDDNCPEHSNFIQTDTDGDCPQTLDGTQACGDVCDDDRDGDGVANDDDACPDTGESSVYVATGTDTNSWDGCGYDTDGDGIYDHEEDENCVLVTNSDDNPDSDGNGYPDCGVTDTDGDGYIDNQDNCPDDSNSAQNDMDGDGAGDICDNDIDGDGLANEGDICPENDSDPWKIGVLRVEIDTDGSCTMASGDQGYPITYRLNYGATTDICFASTTISKEEAIQNMNWIMNIFPLGGIYLFVEGSWDDILDFSQAKNYGDAPTGCFESQVSPASDITVCATLQRDRDADGIGDGCDA